MTAMAARSDLEHTVQIDATAVAGAAPKVCDWAEARIPCTAVESMTSMNPQDYTWSAPTQQQQQQLYVQFAHMAWLCYSQHQAAMAAFNPAMQPFPASNGLNNAPVGMPAGEAHWQHLQKDLCLLQHPGTRVPDAFINTNCLTFLTHIMACYSSANFAAGCCFEPLRGLSWCSCLSQWHFVQCFIASWTC